MTAQLVRSDVEAVVGELFEVDRGDVGRHFEGAPLTAGGEHDDLVGDGFGGQAPGVFRRGFLGGDGARRNSRQPNKGNKGEDGQGWNGLVSHG